jgi:hypothetical protein
MISSMKEGARLVVWRRLRRERESLSHFRPGKMAEATIVGEECGDDEDGYGW